MTVSQLHQQTMASGFISFEEIHGMARHRDAFTPQERQLVVGMIRFIQQGVLNFGCRLACGLDRSTAEAAVG